MDFSKKQAKTKQFSKNSKIARDCAKNWFSYAENWFSCARLRGGSVEFFGFLVLLV